VEFKADPMNAEYILVFGANIYEALQPGINTYGALMAERYSAGKTRFTIIDPRATNGSVHAEEWIAVTPGQDGAFAMGLIRWIIDNNRFNGDYLAAPDAKAAEKKGHGSYSNASHLVIVDTTHPNYRRFLRMSDLNPSLSGDLAQAFVVLDQDSNLQPFDALDSAQLDRDTIATDTTGKSIRVKTAFRLLKEESWKYTLQEYAHLAGVEPAAIERVAKEFTAHGTRAAVCQYHGAGNYASGVPAAYAIALLNVLIGSIDRKGGYLKGGGGAAPWNVGSYDLKSFVGQKKAKGVMLSREKASYETSSEFKRKKAEGGSGYPAKRPWFPFTRGGLCVETLSGIDQMYPYPCKILFSYFFNPVYSIPGGRRFEATLRDEEKVPLHVSIDIGINESNLYADYIVPDITYLEGHYAFLTPHAPALKFTAVRTPAIRPLTDSTTDNRPYCLETFLIDLAAASGLPGFGPNTIPGKDGATHALLQGEDYYLRGDPSLGTGIRPNDLGRLDETLGNLPLVDVMAGIPDFSSTRVRIVKA
jgi:tetrathionate reductase subunit A